jgi:hypothetical protein
MYLSFTEFVVLFFRLKKTWSRRLEERNLHKIVKTHEKEMKDEKTRLKEEEKKRRLEQEERRKLNALKAEVVQTVYCFILFALF